MTATQLQILDFHSPRKPKKRKWAVLSQWHEAMCTLVTESWNSLLTNAIQLSANPINPSLYREAIRTFPDHNIGVHFVIGAARFPSLIVFPQKVLHGLIADILNSSDTEWPPLRKFTRAEDSMLTLLFQGVADAVSDAIPGPEATSCLYVDCFEKAERTRLLAQIDEVFVAQIGIKSRFGEEKLLWILPREATEELVGIELQSDDKEERAEHPQLLSLTQKIEVELMVELGHCQLSMTQAAELAIGDVLILDQNIRRPLVAYVAGEPKWLGKPMRKGQRQAFEIVELLDE